MWALDCSAKGSVALGSEGTGEEGGAGKCERARGSVGLADEEGGAQPCFGCLRLSTLVILRHIVVRRALSFVLLVDHA